MRNYYSIHDDANGLLGLVPHTNSVATALATGTLGPYEYYDTYDWTKEEWRQFYKTIAMWSGIGYASFGSLLMLLRFTGGFEWLEMMYNKWQDFTDSSFFNWFRLIWGIIF